MGWYLNMDISHGALGSGSSQQWALTGNSLPCDQRPLLSKLSYHPLAVPLIFPSFPSPRCYNHSPEQPGVSMCLLCGCLLSQSFADLTGVTQLANSDYTDSCPFNSNPNFLLSWSISMLQLQPDQTISFSPGLSRNLKAITVLVPLAILLRLVS